MRLEVGGREVKEEKYERCQNCGKYGYDRKSDGDGNTYCDNCVSKWGKSEKEYVGSEKERKRNKLEQLRWEGRVERGVWCERCQVLMTATIDRYHRKSNHGFPKCGQCNGRMLRSDIEVSIQDGGRKFCSTRCAEDSKKFCARCAKVPRRPEDPLLCAACYREVGVVRAQSNRIYYAEKQIKRDQYKLPGKYQRPRRMDTL